MFALTALFTALCLAATFAKVAASAVTPNHLFSRQIQQDWIPSSCNSQCDVITQITSGNCQNFDCKCTRETNQALSVCLGCTYHAIVREDPDTTRLVIRAYDAFVTACNNNGTPIPKLQFSSGNSGSGSSGTSGNTGSGSSGTSGGSGSGSSGNGGSRAQSSMGLVGAAMAAVFFVV